MAPGDLTTLAKNSAPKSKASLAVIKADQSLVSMSTMIVDVKTPLSALVVDLTALTDRFIRPGLGLCDDILRLCTSLTKALDLCKVLTVFPGMGQVLNRIVNVIKQMKIDKKVKETVGSIKKMFEDARDKTMKPIVDASNKILRTLQSLVDKLQPCRQMLATMTNIFGLIDLSVHVLFEKGVKDTTLDDSLALLEKASITFTQQITATQRALQPIKTFVAGDKLQTFKKAIAGPLNNELAPLQEKVRALQKSMGPLVDTMTNAMNKLRPVKWVLNKLDWIVNKTIGPIVKFIIDKTLLKDLVDSISNRIKAALGVEELEKRVAGVLTAALKGLQAPLNTALADAEKTSTLLSNFSEELNKFREIPSAQLLVIVSKGLKSKFPNLPTPLSRQVAAVTSPSPVSFDQHDVPHLDDFEDLAPRAVEDQIQSMDIFVRHEFEKEAELLKPAENTVVPPTTSPGPTVTEEAPKFAYAFSEGGETVSVLMRVDHLRISEELSKVGLDAFAPMSAIPSSRVANLDAAPAVADMSASGSGVVSRQATSTAIKMPKLEQFSAKVIELSTAVAKAKVNIGRIGPAAKQLDAVFASIAPEASQFGDHLVSMLARLEPLFKSSSDMLALPIQYRTALAVNLADLLKSAGAPAYITTQISDLFKNIDKATAAINKVRGLLAKLDTQSKKAATTYRAFFSQSILVASSASFPQTLGRSVNNLSGFVEALQARLDQATSNFESFARSGKSLLEDPGQLVDPTSTLASLDEQYGKLALLVDTTITQVSNLAPLVDLLYTASADAHKVVQITHKATRTAMQICRTAEAEVVSADVFRGLCGRLYSAVAPFQTFLAQLSGQVTPTTSPPTSRVSGVTSTQTTSISKQVSQMKTPVPPSSTPSLATIKKANETLGGAPFDIVASLIGPKIFEAMNKNLDAFAKIKDFEVELNQLTSLQQDVAKKGVDNFRIAVANLVKVVEPKDISTLASSTTVESISSMLSQADAQSLADIMKTIETISEKAVTKSA